MFNETNDKTRVIDVWDKIIKDANPVWTINEEYIDGLLEVEGDQTIPSRDWLIAEDKQGLIIGFSCLFKSSKRDSWWMELRVLPEYNRQKISLELFESCLALANKQRAPRILFTARKYSFTDSPIQTKIKEMGLEPVHYNFWMYMDDFNSIPEVINPPFITFKKQKEITDYASYVKINNDAFSKDFEFRPYTEEEIKQMATAEWKGYNMEHHFAFDGEDPVGICSNLINPEQKNIGVVDTLAVLHSHHHRGIGSSLLSLGIQSLIERGCKKIELGVEVNNEKALNLYKKFGFNELESRTTIFYEINL